MLCNKIYKTFYDKYFTFMSHINLFIPLFLHVEIYMALRQSHITQYIVSQSMLVGKMVKKNNIIFSQVLSSSLHSIHINSFFAPGKNSAQKCSVPNLIISYIVLRRILLLHPFTDFVGYIDSFDIIPCI